MMRGMLKYKENTTTATQDLLFILINFKFSMFDMQGFGIITSRLSLSASNGT